MYKDIDEDLSIPLRFKETKCTFTSRVPKRDELETCTHIQLTSLEPWEPDQINLNQLTKISTIEKSKHSRQAYRVKIGSGFTPPTSHNLATTYAYRDPLSDEALLSSVSSSLIWIKELSTSNISVREHPNEQYPAQRTFISRKRYGNITAESLSELWHIGPKRAKATLLSTTTKTERWASKLLDYKACFSHAYHTT